MKKIVEFISNAIKYYINYKRVEKRVDNMWISRGFLWIKGE